MAPDLFEGGPPQTIITGVLLHDAQHRMRQVDREGHVVPVICMDLQTEGVLRLPVHVEQPFPPGQVEQARAAAHRYRKGMRVTVHACALDQRLTLPNAAHIHTHHEHKEAHE